MRLIAAVSRLVVQRFTPLMMKQIYVSRSSQIYSRRTLGESTRSFFPGDGEAFAIISKYDAEKKTYFSESVFNWSDDTL